MQLTYTKKSVDLGSLYAAVDSLNIATFLSVSFEQPSTVIVFFSLDITADDQDRVRRVVDAHNPSVLNEAAHQGLRTLSHNVAENSYTEVNRSSGKTQSVIQYSSDEKDEKISEVILTRDPVTTGKVSIVTSILYENGVEVDRLTQTIDRPTSKVESITAVQG